MISRSDRVRKAAAYFRKLGFSPLPAAEDGKRPDPRLGPYAKFRHQPIDDAWWIDQDWRNLQLMCGCEVFGQRKLLVVDCDGHMARDEVWPGMCRHYGDPGHTWTVATPNGGTHYYFLVPLEVTRVASTMAWSLWSTWGAKGDPTKGVWLPHQEVRILGDGALAMAPPSTLSHSSYTFVEGCSPRDIPVPATAPQWLIDLPPATLVSPMPPERAECAPQIGNHVNKIALARSWGVKFTGGVNAAGWLPCHVPWREDRNPSGSFHAVTGITRDNKDGTSVSFCTLSVRLGRYPDTKTAFKDLSR